MPRHIRIYYCMLFIYIYQEYHKKERERDWCLSHASCLNTYSKVSRQMLTGSVVGRICRPAGVGCDWWLRLSEDCETPDALLMLHSAVLRLGSLFIRYGTYMYILWIYTYIYIYYIMMMIIIILLLYIPTSKMHYVYV